MNGWMASLDAATPALAFALLVSAVASLTLWLVTIVWLRLRPRSSFATRHILLCSALALSPIVAAASLLSAATRPAAVVSNPAHRFAQPEIRTPSLRARNTTLSSTGSSGDTTGFSKASGSFAAAALRAASVLVLVWLGGAVIGLLQLGFALKVVLRIKALSRQAPASLVRLAALARRRPRVRLSDHVSVPVAVGYRRPVVLIPVELGRTLSYGSLAAIVRHELAHLEHYHDVQAVLQQCVVRLFWINPVMHALSAQITFAQECACDAAVAADPAARRRYAEVLLLIAERIAGTEARSALSPAFFRRKQTLERLRALFRNHDPGAPPKAIFAAAFATVALFSAFAWTFAPAAAQPGATITFERALERLAPGVPKLDAPMRPFAYFVGTWNCDVAFLSGRSTDRSRFRTTYAPMSPSVLAQHIDEANGQTSYQGYVLRDATRGAYALTGADSSGEHGTLEAVVSPKELLHSSQLTWSGVLTSLDGTSRISEILTLRSESEFESQRSASSAKRKVSAHVVCHRLVR